MCIRVVITFVVFEQQSMLCCIRFASMWLHTAWNLQYACCDIGTQFCSSCRSVDLRSSACAAAVTFVTGQSECITLEETRATCTSTDLGRHHVTLLHTVHSSHYQLPQDMTCLKTCRPSFGDSSQPSYIQCSTHTCSLHIRLQHQTCRMNMCMHLDFTKELASAYDYLACMCPGTATSSK